MDSVMLCGAVCGRQMLALTLLKNTLSKGNL